MVSSVVAQAILSQRAPDIVGSFRAGQDIAREDEERERQKQIRELSGQAIRGEEGAIDELSGIDPEIAFGIAGQIGARDARGLNEFIQSAGIAQRMLEGGNVQGALDFSDQRIRMLQRQGRDTTQTENIRNLIASGNTDQALNELKAFSDSIFQAKGLTAGQQEFQGLIKDLSPEEQERARRIKVGLDPRAAQRLTAEQELEIEAAKAGGKARGKGQEERQQSAIDKGVEAADSTANLRRTLDLLDTIKTGGLASANLRAKQLFGVEGADEGELSNALGTAVLSQLKATFGAAFTAQEGERLERLSAGFGKSPAANRRIIQQALQIAERSARRGIRAAEARGDTETAGQIREALEFTVEAQGQAVQPIDQPVDQAQAVQPAQAATPPQRTTTRRDRQRQRGQTIGRFQVEVE